MPASSRAAGTRVVLPAPGGARSTREELERTVSTICANSASIGSAERDRISSDVLHHQSLARSRRSRRTIAAVDPTMLALTLAPLLEHAGALEHEIDEIARA